MKEEDCLQSSGAVNRELCEQGGGPGPGRYLIPKVMSVYLSTQVKESLPCC